MQPPTSDWYTFPSLNRFCSPKKDKKNSVVRKRHESVRVGQLQVQRNFGLNTTNPNANTRTEARLETKTCSAPLRVDGETHGHR